MGGAARIFERLAVSPYDFNKISGACVEEEIVGVAANRTGIHLDGFRVGGQREERDQNETKTQDFVALEHGYSPIPWVKTHGFGFHGVPFLVEFVVLLS
jgi:hypothetical protein